MNIDSPNIPYYKILQQGSLHFYHNKWLNIQNHEFQDMTLDRYISAMDCWRYSFLPIQLSLEISINKSYCFRWKILNTMNHLLTNVLTIFDWILCSKRKFCEVSKKNAFFSVWENTVNSFEKYWKLSCQYISHIATHREQKQGQKNSKEGWLKNLW